MCGLFGYAGRRPDDLRTLVKLASRRGPDSIGAAVPVDGRRVTYRGYDAASLPILDDEEGILLGHCRLATSGTKDLADAQPIVLDAGVLTHNGNVYNDAELTRGHGLKRETSNDSEVIGRLIESFYAVASLRSRVWTACHMVDWRSPPTLAYSDGRQVCLARFGQPLYVRRSGRDLAWCSVEFEGSKPLCQGAVVVWTDETRTETQADAAQAPHRHP